MTNPLLIPSVLDASPRTVLTEADSGRIATAIEAELAPSTRAMYAGGWRQWERWYRGRGLEPLPAAPQALAAYLTERAEAGLTFGTLDGYCSGIAHRHHQEALSTRPPTSSYDVCAADCAGSWASRPAGKPTHSPSPNSPRSCPASTPIARSASATGPSSCSATPPL